MSLPPSGAGAYDGDMTATGAPRPGWSFRRLTLGAIGLLALGAGVARVGLGEGLEAPWPWLLLRDAALVLAVAASAWGFGGLAARWWRPDLEVWEDRLARVAVGLGAIGVAELGLGMVGLLRRPWIAALLLAGLLLAIWQMSHVRPGEAVPVAPRWSPSELTLAAALGVAGAVILCGVITPETFYDALYYHDAFPAQYLRHGRVLVFPHAVHSAMPSHVDLLYAPLLAWGGASTVKLGHFALLAGLMGWVGVLGRRLGSRLGGLAGALVLATLPGVGVMAGLGVVDLGVTFFTTGCVALTVAALAGATASAPLLAAAFLAGAAAGSKYSALLFVLVWAVAVLAVLVTRHRPRQWLSLGLGVGALVLAGGGGWYVRNQVVLGNAVYPALSAPGSAASEVVARLQSDSGPPGPWLDTPRVLLDAALERRGLGAGAEVWPGVLLLALGVLWALLTRGWPRWLGVMVILMLLGWARSVLILRYAYPALAVAAVLVGGACAAAPRRGLRAAFVAVVVCAGGLGLARTVHLIDLVHRQPWAFFAGRQGAQEFLSERVPHFQAARWIAATTPDRGTRLLLVGETQGYYFARDFEPVSAYDRHPLAEWAGACSSGGELARLLRGKGFTHVVVNAAELGRLDRRYQHLSLAPREARVVREMLSACSAVWTGAGVSVYALGPPA